MDDGNERIINSVDIVDYIGQYTILQPKNKEGEFIGCCPIHTEDTPSMYVNRNKKKWYCFGCRNGGDIISFVMQKDEIPFADAVKKLCRDYNIITHYQPPNYSRQIFKKVNRSKVETAGTNNTDHVILDKEIYNEFPMVIIRQWITEGIPQYVMNEYEIRMDPVKSRIVYPVYDDNGNFINIKGRTIHENYKELNEPKYINYYKVGKMDYFQCFSKNLPHIKSAGEIIIFEGIKSVMKADYYGYKNCVSAETSGLSIEQIKELINIRCNVVIAFDNDVCFAKIKPVIATLTRFTNVSVVEDRDDLLQGEKMSPVDKGRDVWNMLYSSRRRVLL